MYGNNSINGKHLEEPQARKTAQGYPMQEYDFVDRGFPVDKFYFIIGDKKYVLVQYTHTSGYRDLSDEEKAMIAAAESLVDSFVWAE